MEQRRVLVAVSAGIAGRSKAPSVRGPARRYARPAGIPVSSTRSGRVSPATTTSHASRPRERLVRPSRDTPASHIVKTTQRYASGFSSPEVPK